ncbi:MAG: hybrid sensor histidine kinase/response regulator [Anaerolinea sp.]|nr:hybrid sensor histidine kinase/response regulator [Anaerolinea sp.]
MPKILVVEDEKYLLEDIMELLQYTYFEVAGTPNGQEAIRMAQADPPDLILCDIMMPGMDGYEVLNHIRDNPITENIPFIFLSAKADRESLRQGMNMGADDYISKPFTSAELLTAINMRLKRHHQVIEAAEQRLDYVKQQLARMVTHELRTPLISINTVTDVISRQLYSLSPGELTELLQTIESGSKRLNHRVEQLVYITQLDAGMLTRDSIRDQGLVMTLWELLVASTNLARRFAYQQKSNVGIKMRDRDRDAIVLCNPPALKQALAELIANALTYAPENTDVEIAQWRSEGQIWVTVTDRGQGIPKDKLTAALEAFRQLDRETSERQGIGIGLTLAHRIIYAHGGTLDLRSVVNKGTQVLVNLPLYVENR